MAQYPPGSPYGPPPSPGYGPPPYVQAMDAPMTPAGTARPFGAIPAVKAVFEDPDWKTNVLLALVFIMIPIVGPIALGGWMCETHQRLVRKHPKPVPKIDFSDFGEYIKRGLHVFLVGLIVSLPLSFVLMIVMFGGMFAAGAVTAATSEPLAGLGVGIGVGFVGMLLLLLLSPITNAATTRAELTENFGEALKFGQLMGYAKATFGKVVVKSITFGFVGFGIILLGMLLCYIGMYPAAAVLQIAAMHLRHQIYDDYLARGGEPIPLAAPQPLPSEARPPPMYGG